MLACGLAVLAFMIAYYALPYREAIAAAMSCVPGLGEDGCTHGGELMLAIGYGLPICLLSLLVYRRVNSAYGKRASTG
jgi:multisubunit Na+/H+ antiporter MnhB subunit